MLRQLNVPNSRTADSKKRSAQSQKPPAAAHAVQQQRADAPAHTNTDAQPSTDAGPAAAVGLSSNTAQPSTDAALTNAVGPSSNSAHPAANSNGHHVNGHQEADGLQPAAAGLIQEANNLKQAAEDALHPAVGADANPEPIARVQKRAAAAQPQSGGTAACPESDAPAAKKARVDSLAADKAADAKAESLLHVPSYVPQQPARATGPAVSTHAALGSRGAARAVPATSSQFAIDSSRAPAPTDDATSVPRAAPDWALSPAPAQSRLAAAAGAALGGPATSATAASGTRPLKQLQ